MKDAARPRDYAEFLEASGELLQVADGLDALRKSGLSELLRSPGDGALRSAGFAFLEMQGAAAANSPALSWIALADPVLLGTAALRRENSVLGFAHSADETHTRHTVLGWHESAELLLDLPGSGLVVAPRESISAWASGDDHGDDYVRVIAASREVSANVVVPESIMAERRAAMIARARLAAAVETLGACTRLFDDAVAYASNREQFGQAVVAFQAVRHQLAWAATDRHQLASVIDRAVAQALDRDPDPCLAETAKALAGMVSRSIAQISLQVTGAMGFTWEYSHNQLHRRTMVLDAVLGSSAELSASIGNRARLSGEVPELFDL